MELCNPIDALSDILMEVPDLVFAFADDGRYLFVNQAAARFLGSDSLDVIGRHWRTLGYPDAVMVPLVGKISEVFATGTPQYYRARSSPERGNRELDVSLTPIRCCSEGITGVLAIARDRELLAGVPTFSEEDPA